VSGGNDAAVRVWDLESGELLHQPLTGHDGDVNALALGESHGRAVVASGGNDGTVRLWDPVSGESLGAALQGHRRKVRAVAIGELRGRPIVVSGSNDNTVRVWGLDSGRLLYEPLVGHHSNVTAVAVGQLRGRAIAVSGSEDFTLWVWDLEVGGPRCTLQGHEGFVHAVAVGELGGRPIAVSGGDDKTVRVWALDTGRPLGGPLRGHRDWVTAVAVGALAGRPIAVSGGTDQTVRVWDLEEAGPLGEPLVGHEGWVNAVAVETIGGRSIAVSGGDDNTVRMWDLSAGGPLGWPLRHDRGVNAVAVGEPQSAPPPASGETDRDTDEPAAWRVASARRREQEAAPEPGVADPGTSPEPGVADPGTSPEFVTAGASTSSMPARASTSLMPARASTSLMPGRVRATATQVVASAAGMRIRAHRRLDMVLLLIGVLLVGGAAAFGAVAGDSERVTGLWAGAAIGSDGRAGVVEVIDYDFGTEHRHGIFRDVPGLSANAQVAVSSATAPSDMTLENRGYATRIRIGDPARTITGRHRYKIAYSLDGVAPGGRLAWDAVGTEWPVGIGNVEIHVVAPVEFQGARCVQGEAGSQRPCDLAQPEPGHLVATIGALPAGQGATLYATAGRRLDHAPALSVPSSGLPADATSGVLLAGLVAAAAALVASALTSWLVRRAGRERVARGWRAGDGRAGPALVDRVDAEKLGSLATAEFSPPPELTPAQGGIVLAEAVGQNQKVAWLIGAAADGYLDIEQAGEEVTLVRRSGQDESSVSRTLDTLFCGRDRLTLGAYDPSFAAAWQEIGDELEAWRQTSGLWDAAGDFHRKLAWVLGAVIAVGGLVIAFVGGAAASRWSWVWLALAAWGGLLAGAGLAALVRGWELRIRTPLGCELWLRVESFRRFLAGPQAHHVEEATKQGVLGEYSAWAVAVGEIDPWSRVVATSACCANDPVGRRYSHMASYLPRAAWSSAVEPSSSGSSSGGSFGGGSFGGSGGGAGGGGGGSW